MDDAGRRPDGPRVGVVLLCCLLLLSAVVPGAAADGDPVEISEVAFEGATLGESRDGSVYLWQSEPKTLVVDVDTAASNGEGHYKLCVRSAPSPNRSRTLECRKAVLSGNSTERFSFEFDSWPDSLVGAQTVSVVVIPDTLEGEVAAEASVAVDILQKAADLDGDGLTNQREIDVGTNFTDPDTDGDGLDDSPELTTYGTDPVSPDTDADGLADGPEVHVHNTDPAAADSDDDGLTDAEEISEHGTDPNRVDTDGDGLDDPAEVNTYGTDPGDPDTDGDGLDDTAEVNEHETDPTVADTDGDGLADPLEVHTYGTNPKTADTDGDGLTDGTEVYEYGTDPNRADTDGDGLKDGPEVNAHGTDPNRADTDGDGLEDGPELTRYDTDPTLGDTDGDGTADSRAVDRGSLAVDGAWPAGLVAGGIVFLVGVLLYRAGYRPRLPASTTATAEAAAPDPDDPPPEGESDARAPRTFTDAGGVLTNEERVLALLEANGGRMRQSTIVDEGDWSKATVSRVLARMEEDDRITKINVGRGNIIALPTAGSDLTDPPVDDGDSEQATP